MPASPDSFLAPPADTSRLARARQDRLARRRARQHLRMQRRRVLVSASVVVGVLVAGSGALDWWTDSSRDDPAGQVAVLASPSPTPTPTPSASPTPSPSPTETGPVLALSGEFPTEGSGEFRFADAEGESTGDSGQFRRYRVAVEADSGEDLDEFTEFVAETLAAEDGWTATGEYQFQQVPDGAGHDFTVYLATTGTAAQMCAGGGLAILGDGLPEGGVSCRLPGQVILNLSRWRQSVDHFVAAEVPLEAYRQMVLNHEIGHELGYGHFACPGADEPAPVMQQQSISLDGCEANPWPYLDGEYYAGPPG